MRAPGCGAPWMDAEPGRRALAPSFQVTGGTLVVKSTSLNTAKCREATVTGTRARAAPSAPPGPNRVYAPDSAPQRRLSRSALSPPFSPSSIPPPAETSNRLPNLTPSRRPLLLNVFLLVCRLAPHSNLQPAQPVRVQLSHGLCQPLVCRPPGPGRPHHVRDLGEPRLPHIESAGGGGKAVKRRAVQA